MTTFDLAPVVARPPPSALALAVVVCAVMVPLTLLLLMTDLRVLDAEALWLKPLKFQLALGLHAATL